MRLGQSFLLSNSWSSPAESNQIMDAIDTIVERGCLVVCSAGNTGAKDDPTVQFPARYEKTMAVAALRPDNTRWDFSSFFRHGSWRAHHAWGAHRQRRGRPYRARARRA